MDRATWLLTADHELQPRVLTELCLFEDLHALCRAKGKRNKGNEFSGFLKVNESHFECTKVAQGAGNAKV